MTRPFASTGGTAGARLNRRSIPNVAVLSHDGAEHRFYEDLVRDQTVLINFTSIEHDQHYPSVHKMSEVKELLDQRTDDRTRLLSITIDPEKDTPRLAAYARNVSAGGRWLFLTGTEDDIEALRAAFYVHRGVHQVDGARKLIRRADLLRLAPAKAVMDCSMGLMRYGNEALDIWGGVPARATAEDIAARLTWVLQSDSPQDSPRPRRRGQSGRI